MTSKDKLGRACRLFHSHGDGMLDEKKFKRLGKNVIFEKGVKVFHPENIEIGDNVYVGHGAYLKAYYKNKLVIGSNVWIGQETFLHAGGGMVIKDGVGIGPYVKILTLNHIEEDKDKPVLYSPQEYKRVVVGYGADIGIGSVILPGVKIGKNSIIGAGAVVTKDVPDYSVAIGVPAKVIRQR